MAFSVGIAHRNGAGHALDLIFFAKVIKDQTTGEDWCFLAGNSQDSAPALTRQRDSPQHIPTQLP